MPRFFIRVYNLDSPEPDCDAEVLTEKQANAVLAEEGTKYLMELIPIKTDIRQIKQEVIV